MGVTIPATEGLSDEQIDAVERELQCKLPLSVRAFARQHDGAKPQTNKFDVPGNSSSVRCFISLTDAATLRLHIDGFPGFGVPIAEDDCGNFVWLAPETGEIRFWDHEIDDDGAVIAKDFDTFLAALQPFDPASVVLRPGQVISAWIDPDFKRTLD